MSGERTADFHYTRFVCQSNLSRVAYFSGLFRGNKRAVIRQHLRRTMSEAGKTPSVSLAALQMY